MAPATRPLRIGIIGAGVMGTQHARFIAREEDATLVAVADPYSKTLSEKCGVQHYEHHGDLLAHPGLDAVIIPGQPA